MVKCQWCDIEIKDGENSVELKGPDGSTDGWMHKKCAKQYLQPNSKPPQS